MLLIGGVAAVLLVMASINDGPFSRTARELDPTWPLGGQGRNEELNKSIRGH